MKDHPKARWVREHGYGESHDPGRRGRGGKLAYRTFWKAGQAALETNMGRCEREMVEAYPCRWGDHWAHGETAEVHWHVGHPRRVDESW